MARCDRNRLRILRSAVAAALSGNVWMTADAAELPPPRLRHADQPGRLRGIPLLVLGVTLFGIMDGVGKFLAEGHTVTQIVWARYAFAVPVLLLLTAPRNWPRLLRCRRPGLHAGRALLPLLASTTVILSLRFMPLADATAIGFASPLFVVLLSMPLLRERVSAHTWIGVVCGFAGILVIVRPGADTVSLAALLPLATALFFGLYQVLTRLVSFQDGPLVILAWTIIVGLAITSALLPLHWAPVSGRDAALMAFSGVLFGLGQLLLIAAFEATAASVLTAFTYAQIVAAVAFGAAVFGEVPDGWTLIGTAVVILSGIYVLRRQATT
jgi:drug/metabolite transporter (DMT)-like permease